MSDIERIVDLLAATAEVCGGEVKPAALVVMAQDLAAYPLPQVEAALTRVRREVTGRFTLAAVISRLAECDGRPGADEAWAMAMLAIDESETVVWTREMAEAFGIAKAVLDGGDKIGARMAFRSAYERIISDSRANLSPVKWEVSLGYDSSRRETALMAAVERGLLTAPQAQPHLPHRPTESEHAIAGLLTGKVIETSDKSFNERLDSLRRMLKGDKEAAERERAKKIEERMAADRERKEAVAQAVEQWQKDSA
jgi:hypothetical protein